MNNIKIISGILFYITRIVAVIYLIITFYALLSILTEWSYILKDSGKYFSVCIPFTEKPFLVGENYWGYKLFSFIIPIGLYGLFFLLVSNIFKVFKQPKLFTQYGVSQLKLFSVTNIIIPPIAILLASIFSGDLENGIALLAVVHFILGVFAYFLSAIFNQGLSLQNEQDLFI